jgi:transcription initiation factor TFIIH subunit 1
MAEPMDVDHNNNNNNNNNNNSNSNPRSETTVYDNVRWKKQTGSLHLHPVGGLSFQTSAASAAGPTQQVLLQLEWSRIAKHQVSPVTYPKALLKLIVLSSLSSCDNKNNNSVDNSFGGTSSSSSSSSNTTTTTVFQMENRNTLQAIRNDVTLRLQHHRSGGGAGGGGGGAVGVSTMNGNIHSSSKKRPFSEVSKTSITTTTAASTRKAPPPSSSSTSSSSSLLFASSFGEMDATALAVTRSTLLAAHPALRQQHEHLVEQSQTIAEDDFWSTHRPLVEEEYAKMAGCLQAGTSSLLQSHVPASGRVTLGVEEMRQIFILYPAVHQAYEQKVPLELSDEQFWRKYLESEFFHRDRGRMGIAARQQGGMNNSASVAGSSSSSTMNEKKKGNTVGDAKKEGPSLEEQDARAAAVGTDDMFSRFDAKIQAAAAQNNATREASSGSNGGTFDGINHVSNSNGEPGGDGNNNSNNSKKWGTHLAIGQFDLAQTLETERGSKLLTGPRDNHPPNNQDIDGGKGARVIQKYNRHWAMVLHPEEAVAGCNLLHVARKSVQDAAAAGTTRIDHHGGGRLDGGSSRSNTSRVILQDAAAGGGVHEEMTRLVDFASSEQGNANHATGIGVHEGLDCEPLTLHNVEAYYSGNQNMAAAAAADDGRTMESRIEMAKKHALLSKTVAAKTLAIAKSLRATSAAAQSGAGRVFLSPKCFPEPNLGRELLNALTKKMAQDSRTEAASLEMVSKLPDDFRKRLQAFFRRSSELLRHFFGLRRLSQEETNSSSSAKASINQKLARIVRAMESFYREMEVMRKDLPQSETGEMMRKMCLPIMDQLDLAFKLHRECSGRGGGGGFVDVEEN